MTTWDKPFITYDQMIELMKKRNIIINDVEFAKKTISNLSYYGLINGYKNTFLTVPSSDKFIEGTKFEELYTINLIDVSLNNIIFKYILYLEKSLKSKVSYVVSQKYGVYTNPNDYTFKDCNDYLCRKYYSRSNGKRNSILIKLKDSIHNHRDNSIIEHYINDKNHIPAWILTYNIPFGLAIEWYSILKDDDKKAVCNEFISTTLLTTDEKKEFLRKALMLAKEYRNKIAHGNRTFNIRNLPILPKKPLLLLSHNCISESEYNQGMGQSDILAVMILLIILCNDKYLITNFYSELFSLFNPYINTTFNTKTIFEVFGMPNTTLHRILQLINYIYT